MVGIAKLACRNLAIMDKIDENEKGNIKKRPEGRFLLLYFILRTMVVSGMSWVSSRVFPGSS